MLRRSLASAALRPLTAVAHGRHSCVRRLSITAAGDVSIALPKFLVTTVKTEQVGDKVTYNSSSIESSELPVFLVDVKYEGKASVAGQWKKTSDEGIGKEWNMDNGEGDFSGTAVSQVLVTSSSHSPQPEFQPWPHTSRSWPLTFCGTNFNLSGGVHRGAGQ